MWLNGLVLNIRVGKELVSQKQSSMPSRELGSGGSVWFVQLRLVALPECRDPGFGLNG